jgi:glutamyl-tRNA reductase
MSILVVGLSHRTAPVRLLERVSIGPETLPALLDELIAASEHVNGAMVLSSCNRTEVYAEVERFHGGVTDISALLAERAGLAVQDLGEHLYVHYADAAVEHAFTVAAGLDSMVVGEPQVLGQLRAAYAAAVETGAVGRELHLLAQRALRAGKRVHSDTGIDAAGASIVTAGLDVLETTTGPLAGRSVVVVGAGSMGALTAAVLCRREVSDLVIANRTLAKAERMAAGVSASAVGLDRLEEVLASADAVVCSTGAAGLVLGGDLLERVVKDREGRPLAVLDLALPRDVDPAAADLPGLTLVDLETLQTALAGAPVNAEVARARQLIAEDVATFLGEQRSQRVAPTVTALRAHADELIEAELRRLDGKLPDLEPAVRAELHETVRRVVKTLLHTPTVRVKELSLGPDGDRYASALRELFELDPAGPDTVTRANMTLKEQA